MTSFFSKVDIGPREPDGTRCLLWTGCVTDRGYGQFRDGPRRWGAHRWLYSRWFGLDEGLHLHHLCANKACVNPAHLTPITQEEHTKIHWKTHCPQGHPYDEANTYISKQGSRHCRACARERANRRNAKNRRRT